MNWKRRQPCEILRQIQALLERGLQQEVDFENRWPEVLGTLVKT
jgi:hypothetical protein